MARVAVVTGSNRGIGLAIAERLVADGFRVVMNGRSRTGLKEARRLGATYVRADVTNPSGARKLAAAAPDADVLVNNVGDFFLTPVEKFELDKWEELFTSNLRSAWLVTREILPRMRRRKSGVIVNIGGPVAQTVKGNPRFVAYSMSKSALVVFTKSLAQAVAAEGVRVNVVNPGFIRTYAYSAEEVREMAPKVPAKRLGEPADVAGAVAYLASDAAKYVTGAALDVCGGLWV